MRIRGQGVSDLGDMAASEDAQRFLDQWIAEHGEAPPGKAWSIAGYTEKDGVRRFNDAQLVNVPGFPPVRVWRGVGYCPKCGEGAPEPCTTFVGEPPDTTLYMESELAVAGALSTMPLFENHHPAYALPYARKAMEALSEWEPSDG